MKAPGGRKYVWGSILVAMAMLFPAMSVDAAGVRLDATPSLRLEEGWWSNVNNTSDDEISSPGTRVVPGIELKFSSPDNVAISFSGNYERVWYHDSEANESNYDTWYFRVDSTGGWKLTPVFTFLPSVYYVNTVDSSRRSHLVPSGDPILPPVSITNYGDTKSTDFGGGVNLSYLVTPSVSVGLSGFYTEQRFGSTEVSSTDLEDSTQTLGRATVSYQITPRTQVGLLGSWGHQSFSESPDAETYAGGLTYTYLISEAFKVDMAVGVAYVRQESVPGRYAEKDTTPSGGLNISYTDKSTTASFFGSYVYSGSSGYGEVTRQATVGLTVTEQFTREWTWHLSGVYQNSTSVFTEDAVDIKTTYVTAGLRYQVLEWVSLDLTGNYDHQESKGQTGSTMDNFSALLGVTVSRPYNLF